jgi:hypothetical protein
MEVYTDKRIINSLKVLFESDLISNTDSFLSRLEDRMLKKAYREKIKSVHPDKAVLSGESPEELNHKAGRVIDAYQIILKHLNENKKVSKTFFYQAPMPKRKFRFAEYLFYSGLIDWTTLIGSIVWQYRIRPKFGEIAVSLSLLKKEDIFAILRNKKWDEKFGVAALRAGKISQGQLQSVLYKQKLYNKPIGKYFVEMNILKEEEVQKLLYEHSLHNFRYSK